MVPSCYNKPFPAFCGRNIGNLPTGTLHTFVHLSKEQSCFLKQKVKILRVFICLYEINSCSRNMFTYFRGRL